MITASVRIALKSILSDAVPAICPHQYVKKGVLETDQEAQTERNLFTGQSKIRDSEFGVAILLYGPVLHNRYPSLA